jgi:NADH-quinone oxidoreductase subunit M
MSLNSLIILLLLPLIGAAIITFLSGSKTALIRSTAIFYSTATLLFIIYLILWGDVTPISEGLWLSFEHKWHSRLGTSFSLGVDGFSYPMVILTALLVWVAILASASIKKHPKGYYLLMLALETAVLGVFMARDWGLFYIFWEATLIPLFFLIDRWGGKGRQTASLNFFLYTMAGSVFMLLSLLILFDATPAHSFSFTDIAAGAAQLSADQQMWIFLGLLLGFGVKMPIFPLHGWLPLAHVEASGPVSILLSGILLKMGAYGLILSVALLPKAAVIFQTPLMILALIGITYGALLAWRQPDMKKMIAYSSVGHMGVVLLGISTLNMTGMTGALYQMFAHGLVAAALFMLIALLYERSGTKNINDYGSLLKVTPRFAFFIVIGFIAGTGLPGTAGFVAELYVMIGSFEVWHWAVVFLFFGIMVSATYGLRTIKRLFTGPSKPVTNNVEDLKPVEVLALGVLTTGIMVFGFYPAPFLDLIMPSVTHFINALSPVLVNATMK